MEPILNLLGAGENTFRYARQYALCVIVLGGIPTVLSNVLSNLIRSVGRSREAGAGIILGGLLNIGLDPLFMFVLLSDGYELLEQESPPACQTASPVCISSACWFAWEKGRWLRSASERERPAGTVSGRYSPWECLPLLPPSCLIWIM